MHYRTPKFLHLALALLLFLGACATTTDDTDTESTSTSVLSCAASATLVSGSLSAASSTVTLSNPYVYIYNGTANYTVTIPGLGTVTTASSPYTTTNTFSTLVSSTAGSLATDVSVIDADGNSATCALSTGTTTTSALTCTLETSSTSIAEDVPLYLRITTSTGEALNITSWDPGDSWGTAPPYPLYRTSGQIFWVRYTGTGTKAMAILATGTSGVSCNGGAAMTASVNVY